MKTESACVRSVLGQRAAVSRLLRGTQGFSWPQVCVCVCVCVCKPLSHVRLFATPWTVARQPPLSVGFSRQENWSGLSFPSPAWRQVAALKELLRLFHSCTNREKKHNLRVENYFLNLFLIGGKLLYNSVLVSAIQQLESAVII